MDLVESAISENEGARHPWEKARLVVIQNLIADHLGQLKDQEIRVLDIGCGDSWLIEQLSEYLPKAHFTAVDTAFDDELISQYQERLARDKFRFFSDLEPAFKEQDSYDLVLLLDVIEHIEEEISFLKNVLENNSCLNASSNFLITVPAYQSLFSAHDVFLGHFRRYSNNSLERRLNLSGLEVDKIGYFFSSLLIPRGIIKLLESSGLKSKEAKGIGDHKEGALDNMIEKTLIFDFKFSRLMKKLGINLPGLSNYAIAIPKSKTT